MSETQIWNIENGRTTNPQSRTRERLAGALGETTPAETIALTEEDASISDVGVFTDFDPYDDDGLPTDAGIYVFYDVSDRPIYVGQSDSIRRRVREHAPFFWFKWPIVAAGAYVRIDDQKLRQQVEATMIRFLKSNAVINKKHVER